MNILKMMKIVSFAEVLLNDDIENDPNRYFNLDESVNINDLFDEQQNLFEENIDKDEKILECFFDDVVLKEYTMGEIYSVDRLIIDDKNYMDYNKYINLDDYNLTMRNYLKLEKESVDKINMITDYVKKTNNKLIGMLNNNVNDIKKYQSIISQIKTKLVFLYSEIAEIQFKRIEDITNRFLHDVIEKIPHVDKMRFARCISAMNLMCRNIQQGTLNVMCDNLLNGVSSLYNNIMVILTIEKNNK